MATIQNLNFNPTSISGCALWLDASDASTLLISAGNVLQWNDKSGNGRNTSTVFGSPQLRFSGGFGSLPSVYFGSSTAFSGPLSYTGNTLTTFIVGRINSSNVGQRFLSLGQVGRFDFGTSTDIVPLTVGNLTTEFGWYRNVGSGTGSAFVTTVYNAPFLYSLNVNGSTGVIVYNGSTTSSGTTSGNFGYSTYALAAGINTTAVTPSSGDVFIAEVLVYNASFTQTQRQQVEGYLAWKWGLQGSLPTSHPYYYIAPNTAGLGYPAPIPVPVQRQAFLVSSSPLFLTPTSIAGCTLWLDGADRSTQNATTITSWRDKSGQGNTATATTGPTQATYNGYPVVNFNGSTQSMTSGNSVPLTTHTLIAVHRPAVINGNSQGNTSLFRYQTGAVASYIIFPFMDATSPRGYVTSADGTAIDAANSTLIENSSTGTLNIIIAVISSGSQTIFKNGTQQSSNTQSLSGSSSSTLTIGSALGVQQFYQGSLGEMIVYSSALSTTSRQQIEGYLAWKWGLVGLLPSNHPYKTVSPSITINVTLPSYSLQSATFNPRNIAGIQLWLDGLDPLGTGAVLSNGTTVSTWVDKSGNGKNGTASGTPTYLSGGGISFNGTNAYYTNTSFSYDLSKRSVFIVLKVNTYLANAGVLPFIPNPSSGSDGTATTGLSIETFTNVLRVYGNSGGYFSDIPNTSLTTVNMYNDNMNTTQGLQYLNGNLAGNPSATYTAGSTSGYGIGARWLSGAVSTQYLLTGNIYEVLLYTGPLTTQQRQSVEGYLAWKWGLTGSLPATHPFKRFPPPPN